MPYRLDDLDSEPPDDELKGSEDMELSDDVNAGVHSETSTSPQMASRHRPATYGKSPEATEKPSFGFQREVFQTNIELDPRSAVSAVAIDVSEKGCQTVLYNCGSCADESNSASVSSDTRKGYFLFCINAICRATSLSVLFTTTKEEVEKLHRGLEVHFVFSPRHILIQSV